MPASFEVTDINPQQSCGVPVSKLQLIWPRLRS